MARSLKNLLDKVPGSREVLPYLAALERALAADGTVVLDAVPLSSLRRMGTQLAALPVAADDMPLRALNVQLMAAIDRRELPPPPAPAARADPIPFLPSALDESRVEVTEVSESEWAEASRISLDGPGCGLELVPIQPR